MDVGEPSFRFQRLGFRVSGLEFTGQGSGILGFGTQSLSRARRRRL